jgi:hypothetical protein
MFGDYSLIDFTVSPAAYFEEFIQKKGGWVSNYRIMAFFSSYNIGFVSDLPVVFTRIRLNG